jgi:C1A family cysteine protease
MQTRYRDLSYFPAHYLLCLLSLSPRHYLQGYCGSCWAFSVTEQLESDSMRQHGSAFIMSPQELVSCDNTDAGCNGGWPTTAYDWIEKEGGLVAESDYPYTSGTAGVSGTCDSKLETYSKLVTVTDYYTLRTESSMASYALATGPIAIAVDASAWSSYTGGILTKCGTSIDHAVQITGINLDQNYWKVKKESVDFFYCDMT